MRDAKDGPLLPQSIPGTRRVSRPDWDAIVVGGGPAGASAAFYLSRAGLATLVVEKERLPRYKACGGAIPRQALDRFPLDFGGLERSAPDQVRLACQDLPTVDVALAEKPVAMVIRSEFDAFLLSHSGAEVLEESTVTGVREERAGVQVTVGGRTLTARYLVGADGAASRVARILGLRRNRQLGGALEAHVPLPDRGPLCETYRTRALFSLAAVDWGYAWVFPKGESLAVGIGRFRPGRVDLHRALKDEMDRLGIELESADVHGHPLPSYPLPSWPLGLRRPQERLATRRCLLVGDAAGLVDPLLGEGIRYALASGRLAATAIAGDDLSVYERSIDRDIGRSLATAGRVANAFYRLPRLCYQIGVRNPAVIHLFADLLTERRSYVGIERQLVALTALRLTGRRQAVAPRQEFR